MKYVEWLAEHDRLWNAVRADEEAWRTEHGVVRDPRGFYGASSEWGTLPSHAPLDALRSAMRREYKLSDRAWISIAPQQGPEQGFVAWSRYYYDHPSVGAGWNTTPQPHHHTPAEHRMIAEVIQHAIEWVEGRIDEMRPSDPNADQNGAW